MRLKVIKHKIDKVNKAYTWFFEKTNKSDKCLIRMFKEKEGKNNQITNEHQNINTNSTTEDYPTFSGFLDWCRASSFWEELEKLVKIFLSNAYLCFSIRSLN